MEDNLQLDITEGMEEAIGFITEFNENASLFNTVIELLSEARNKANLSLLLAVHTASQLPPIQQKVADLEQRMTAVSSRLAQSVNSSLLRKSDKDEGYSSDRPQRTR